MSARLRFVSARLCVRSGRIFRYQHVGIRHNTNPFALDAVANAKSQRK